MMSKQANVLQVGRVVGAREKAVNSEYHITHSQEQYSV